MITVHGTEILRTDQHRHKFASAMAEFLYEASLHGDGDDFASAEVGCYSVRRFGRRLLFENDQGYVWTEREATEREAIERVEDAQATDLYEPQPDDVPEAALVTLLWQGHESAEGCEPESYSGDPQNSYGTVPADVREAMAVAWVPFELKARRLLAELDEEEESVWSKNDDGLAHDWVLTSFHHGAGFWDRYHGGADPMEDRSQLARYVTLGKKLTELTRDHPCPEGLTFFLYNDDDGRPVWFMS